MKADYGAVPLAEAKAELVDDTNIRPAPQSRRRNVALLIVGISLLFIGWLIFRGSHGSTPTKGSTTQPLVVPPGPPVVPSNDSGPPEPLGPKGLKSDKKATKNDPKKTNPKIPSMKESKKGPKSPKASPKKKETKATKKKSQKM